jgi:hypothetical protein
MLVCTLLNILYAFIMLFDISVVLCDISVAAKLKSVAKIILKLCTLHLILKKLH